MKCIFHEVCTIVIVASLQRQHGEQSHMENTAYYECSWVLFNNYY